MLECKISTKKLINMLKNYNSDCKINKVLTKDMNNLILIFWLWTRVTSVNKAIKKKKQKAILWILVTVFELGNIKKRSEKIPVCTTFNTILMYVICHDIYTQQWNLKSNLSFNTYSTSLDICWQETHAMSYLKLIYLSVQILSVQSHSIQSWSVES